jgi:hypothetical protein
MRASEMVRGPCELTFYYGTPGATSALTIYLGYRG